MGYTNGQFYFPGFPGDDKDIPVTLEKLMTRVHLENDGYIMNITPINKPKDDAQFNYCHQKIKITYTKHTEKEDIKTYNAHIKSVPILDIIDMMKGKYVPEKIVACLPVREREFGKTFEKINDHNNQAYVECVTGYALSNLVEQGLCPGFPKFYGHFTGIVPELKVDITEDFYHIRNQAWFHRGMGSLFTIETEELDGLEGEDKTGKQIRKITIMDEEFGFTSEMKSIAEDPDIIQQEWDDTNRNGTQKDIFDIIEINSINREDSKNNIIVNNEPLEPVNLSKHNDADSEEVHTESSSEYGYDDDDSKKDVKKDDKGDVDDVDEDESYYGDDDDDESKGVDSKSESQSEDESYEETESEEDDSIFYAVIKNVPVQSVIYEDLCGCIDDLIMKGKTTEEEWLGILFQISFSLTIAQLKYGFVHNDLHTNNVMWSNTNEEYLYYNVEGELYKIPTFGKIIKIIDFGRSYIRFQNKEYFSDAFHQKGDAAGQYNYPPYFNTDEAVIPPNKSFDLPRLACAIYESMYDSESNDDTPLRNILYKWLIDCRGKNILWNRDGIERFAGFGLYRHIARYCNDAEPKTQLNTETFQRFKIKSNTIPEGVKIYNL